MVHHLYVSRKRAKSEDIIYIHNAQADVDYCKAAMHSCSLWKHLGFATLDFCVYRI